MSLCKHCVSGSIHEGTPKGKVEQIDGHDVYVAVPTKDYPKDKALLMLSDVFGLPLVNNKVRLAFPTSSHSMLLFFLSAAFQIDGTHRIFFDRVIRSMYRITDLLSSTRFTAPSGLICR